MPWKGIPLDKLWFRASFFVVLQELLAWQGSTLSWKGIAELSVLTSECVHLGILDHNHGQATAWISEPTSRTFNYLGILRLVSLIRVMYFGIISENMLVDLGTNSPPSLVNTTTNPPLCAFFIPMISPSKSELSSSTFVREAARTCSPCRNRDLNKQIRSIQKPQAFEQRTRLWRIGMAKEGTIETNPRSKYSNSVKFCQVP
ncbi:M48 family peptidase [Sesbania bispinosa]|nr:M48 family peptidase [Sesbania bispinosa]